MNEGAADLKAKALAATPGPWVVYRPRRYYSIRTGDGIYLVEGRVPDLPTASNAAHMAACDPQTVLALIEAWEVATADLRTLRAIWRLAVEHLDAPDIEMDAVLDVAIDAGLAERVDYDPEGVHADMGLDCEAGEEIVVLTPQGQRLAAPETL